MKSKNATDAAHPAGAAEPEGTGEITAPGTGEGAASAFARMLMDQAHRSKRSPLPAAAPRRSKDGE